MKDDPIAVCVLLFEGAEELDYAGPWEVFAAAGHLGGGFEVHAVATELGPLRSAKGLRVLADHTLAQAPAPDVLVVPGGIGAREAAVDPETLAWIARVAPGCRFITSVCTGAQVLAAAGPAKGRRVTTHWSFVETLRERGDVAEVLEGVRYVRDGNVVTAAGVSAGIDMSLWLVGQLRTPTFARKVQHYIEYEPAPPYAAEV
jgi:transcriptional regulator GlxA family with amidase domain